MFLLALIHWTGWLLQWETEWEVGEHNAGGGSKVKLIPCHLLEQPVPSAVPGTSDRPSAGLCWTKVFLQVACPEQKITTDQLLED